MYMKFIHKMNGWQRLWVLLATLYLVPVAIFTIPELPTESSIRREWAHDLLEALRRHDLIPGSTSDYRREVFKDANDEEVIDKVRKAVSRMREEAKEKEFAVLENEIGTLEKQYQDRLSGLLLRQLGIIGMGVLFWLIPAIFLYLVGVGVGWVYRGFKERTQ
jgi:hypothetical protein